MIINVFPAETLKYGQKNLEFRKNDSNYNATYIPIVHLGWQVVDTQ